MTQKDLRNKKNLKKEEKASRKKIATEIIKEKNNIKEIEIRAKTRNVEGYVSRTTNFIKKATISTNTVINCPCDNVFEFKDFLNAAKPLMKNKTSKFVQCNNCKRIFQLYTKPNTPNELKIDELTPAEIIEYYPNNYSDDI